LVPLQGHPTIQRIHLVGVAYGLISYTTKHGEHSQTNGNLYHLFLCLLASLSMVPTMVSNKAKTHDSNPTSLSLGNKINTTFPKNKKKTSTNVSTFLFHI